MTDRETEATTVDAQTVTRARATMLANLTPIADHETVRLDEAPGRYVAEALLAPFDVPPFDNSAMDGYALRWSDLEEAGGRLPVAGRVAAGDARVPLPSGTALRIFTGAVVPEGADTIVRQEQVRLEHGVAHVQDGAKDRLGANVRPAGGDLAHGDTALRAGRRLLPFDLGLAASVGANDVRVVRRARVALLVTGDELTDPGEPLAPGRIFESNGVMLAALVRALGGDAITVRRVRDTSAETRAALADAAVSADLVVTSGGVSVGEEDHVKTSVGALGSLLVDGLPIQPGKPIGFGLLGATPWLGLPGNPVASLLTFLLFGGPILRRLHGSEVTLPEAYTVAAGFERPRAMQREAHIRVRREGTKLIPVAKQGSGVLSSAGASHGVAIVPFRATVAHGDGVAYHPFTELLA
jgi:molybdopterin molybdotransferase